MACAFRSHSAISTALNARMKMPRPAVVIHLRCQDRDRVRASLDALAGRAQLAYDAHWAWRDLYGTVPTVSRWRDLGLAFLEDPFPPELIWLAPHLRAETGLRLALGEDAVSRWAFQDLFDLLVPDVIRIDATTMGELGEAIKVCAMASVHARPVIPHVFPEIHGISPRRSRRSRPFR